MLDRLNYRYSGPGTVLSFKANSQYVVTAYLQLGSYKLYIWAASYNASNYPRINITTWVSDNYLNVALRYSVRIKYSALSESFYLYAVRTPNTGQDIISISPIATYEPRAFFKSYFDAIAIRDVIKNSRYKIYYSYVKDSGVELNAQDIYINKTVHSHRSYNIGTNNCANKIEANDKVVVIA